MVFVLLVLLDVPSVLSMCFYDVSSVLLSKESFWDAYICSYLLPFGIIT